MAQLGLEGTSEVEGFRGPKYTKLKLKYPFDILTWGGSFLWWVLLVIIIIISRFKVLIKQHCNWMDKKQHRVLRLSSRDSISWPPEQESGSLFLNHFTHVHCVRARGFPQLVRVLLPRQQLYGENGFASHLHLGREQEPGIVKIDDGSVGVLDLVGLGRWPLEVVLVEGLHEVSVPPVGGLVQVGVPDVQGEEVAPVRLATGACGK